MSAHLKAYIAILAGGVGARFWPASTPERPKQLLPLASAVPLIDETLDRAVELVGSDRVRVVTSDGFAELMRASLERHGVEALLEPAARGTGPALAWAAHVLESESPAATMISMHADHRITPLAGLRDTLVEAVRVAESGHLCCIGVRPDRPETGYGYVRIGQPLGGRSYRVRRFVEKPDEETARRYQASGEYLWNTGIFVWRSSDLLEAVHRHAPEIAGALPRLEVGDVPGFFDAVEPIAIDVAVMERAERVATVEARFAWDDLGVWDAVARSRGTDAEDNAVVGAARTLDARRNIVWTESVRANLIGVEDLLVVEANGELLVMPRGNTPRLKELVREIQDRGEPTA
ncbi:MAG: mannose-1-phosphate guanylyltransferase [Gemmatimonadota bacterium]|nr:mannose-1-phosphate guanylyltransferase [Gemmatimonadota bacterium]